MLRLNPTRLTGSYLLTRSPMISSSDFIRMHPQGQREIARPDPQRLRVSHFQVRTRGHRIARLHFSVRRRYLQHHACRRHDRGHRQRASNGRSIHRQNQRHPRHRPVPREKPARSRKFRKRCTGIMVAPQKSFQLGPAERLVRGAFAVEKAGEHDDFVDHRQVGVEMLVLVEQLAPDRRGPWASACLTRPIVRCGWKPRASRESPARP